MSEDESYIREHIDEYDESKLSMNVLSLDFVREFKDKINISTFFNYLYGCYKMRYLLQNLKVEDMKTFHVFLFDYNSDMYLEFIREYKGNYD